MTARKDIPRRVHSLLSAPANVALHGTPGAGKSWVSDQVRRLLEANSQTVLRIDLSTMRAGRDVFVEMQELLSPGARLRSAEDSIRTVWRALRLSLEASDGYFVILLDEFDRVLQYEDALDFLLLFRELVHRPESMRCTALIASRRSLQTIETKISGISTLASVCYTQYLGGLAVEDLADLGPGVDGLTSDDMNRCLKWSGGHPVLAKYWLTTRPDLVVDMSAELERSRVVFRVIDHLSDTRLLDAAAQYILGPVVDDLPYEKQELELLGVLGVDTPDHVPSSLSEGQHFRDALRLRTWDLNPWGILGEAEVRLRGLIDNTLSEAYGDDWSDALAKKSAHVSRIREDARAKQDRDSRRFSRQGHWLSYTYPGDLWAFVQLEWSLFAPVFHARDKAYWRQVMVGLAEYRAPLAHARAEVLSDAQRTQCRLFAEEVVRAISDHDRSRVQPHE